jgi:pimeloyl-ACP methyl ester carboxylesterase
MAISRRGALAGAATAAALAGLGGRAQATAAPRIFILVHGAWHGGWCWRDVAAALRAQGHIVHTPTLTGMGDRVHLGTRDTGIAVHAEDIFRAAEAEEVSGATLVLHSYAGLPGSVALDRLGSRVAHAVYLDAIFPVPGAGLLTGTPPETVKAAVAALIDGYKAPPFPPQAFGVTDPAQVAWLERRLTTMTWRAVEDVLPPLGTGFAAADKHYVVATGNALPGPKTSAEKAKAAGWTMHALATGHDTMVTAPVETAALLMKIAGA